MNNNKPIGIFDSGVGGLSVLKELIHFLPNESFIYYADSGNCPYGEKSKDEILNLTIYITNFLIKKECKLIIVACNTITTNIINELRKKYNIPFIGIEPATKPASLNSETGNIGILATKGTLNGSMFQDTMKQYAGEVKVHTQIGYGLVELIESDKIDSDEMRELLIKYLHPMIQSNIDNLALGCTHYNFLTGILKEITKNKVNIINTSNAIAKQAKYLTEKELIASENRKRSINIYSSGNTDILRSIITGLNISEELKIENVHVSQNNNYK